MILFSFQINNCEAVAVKMPRNKLDVLTKDEALTIALEQEEVRNKLVTWKVIDSCFTLHNGLQGIINLVTNRKTEEELKLAQG